MSSRPRSRRDPFGTSRGEAAVPVPWIHDRLLRTGLAELTDPVPTPLHAASRTYQKAIDQLTNKSGLAA